MTSVDEINRIEDLAQLRPVWDKLLAETLDASFFHRLQWLEVYWQHFGAGQKLRGLIVSSAGEPIGILPLVVRAEPTKVGPVRVLTYPLHDWGSFYGPIGPQPEATMAAGLAHIRRTVRDWDLVELRWIDAGGPDGRRTEQAMQSAGLQAAKTVWDRTAVVDLEGGWETYLAARTSKWRNNLRRTERRLGRQGRVDYLRYRPRGQAHGEEDPRWDLYDLCEDIARRSWQGSSTSGTTLSHESIRRFLRASHLVAVRAGALDLNLLLLDQHPLAFAYNYFWGSTVYGLRSGYDAELSREGAGNLLFARAIEDSCRRGDLLHDLGAGYIPCKRHLLTRVIPIFRYSHFHPAAPRALLLRMKRWLQGRPFRREASVPAAAAC